MLNSTTLLSRNLKFASEAHKERSIAPTHKTLILSCLDARTDPAHFLALAPGEALVLRNAGGRVTPEVERQIGLLIAIAQKNRLGPLEIIVVHHTDCGMERLAAPGACAALAAATGIPDTELRAWSISDHQGSLATDLLRLRTSALIPEGTSIRGFLLDHKTGRLQQHLGQANRAKAQP